MTCPTYSSRQDELNQLLGQSLSPEDDVAVALEMEALEEEALLDEKTALPQVPKTRPEQRATQEVRKDPEAESLGQEEGRRLTPMLAS